MSKAKRKADHEVLFLEVPVGLKERLAAVAEVNRRSMTAEAVVAIERHVAAEEARIRAEASAEESVPPTTAKGKGRKAKGGGK